MNLPAICGADFDRRHSNRSSAAPVSSAALLVLLAATARAWRVARWGGWGEPRPRPLNGTMEPLTSQMLVLYVTRSIALQARSNGDKRHLVRIGDGPIHHQPPLAELAEGGILCFRIHRKGSPSRDPVLSKWDGARSQEHFATERALAEADIHEKELLTGECVRDGDPSARPDRLRDQ